MIRARPRSPLFPYTTLFRSEELGRFGARESAELEPRKSPDPARRFERGSQPLRRVVRSKGDDEENFGVGRPAEQCAEQVEDRKSTRLNSSHGYISYAVFCLK